jgi:hypothetical protein
MLALLETARTSALVHAVLVAVINFALIVEGFRYQWKCFRKSGH